MTDFARRIIDRACTNKKPYTTIAHAKADARSLNAQAAGALDCPVSKLSVGQVVRAYRCPFGDGTRAHHHWHVGHVPSLEGLADIARAIREAHEPTLVDA